MTSIRHRVRSYERALVAAALFATLGITGFAAPSSGDEAHGTVGPIGILGIPEETAQLVASLKDPEERTSGGWVNWRINQSFCAKLVLAK